MHTLARSKTRSCDKTKDSDLVRASDPGAGSILFVRQDACQKEARLLGRPSAPGGDGLKPPVRATLGGIIRSVLSDPQVES